MLFYGLILSDDIIGQFPACLQLQLHFILAIKWNSGLVKGMLVLFTVAIASAGVKFFGEEKADKGRSSHADKNPKQRDFKHNPTSERISSSTTLSDTSNEKAYHSYEDAYHSYEEAYKEEFKDNTTRKGTGTDYEEEWLNKCSLREGGNSLYRKKNQLQIPGCGGSASLACPEGCLIIHKVFTRSDMLHWIQFLSFRKVLTFIF